MTICDTEIVIAGAGPVGLAAAVELAERGWRVAVVSPAVRGRWSNNFGVWVDEFPYADALGRTWRTASVVINAEKRHVLDRAYARIQNDVLQDLLVARLEQAGGLLIDGSVDKVSSTSDGLELFIGSERTICATLAVDATGHVGALVRRGAARAWQVAYGIDADIVGFSGDPDVIGFMDWREATPDDDPRPTFLYAMPLGNGRVFLEETSLASDPPMRMECLRGRLDERLRSKGWSVRKVHGTEFCRIPLDPSMPVEPPGVVALGASASMVHPATGYQLSRGLQAAGRLADSLQRGASRDALARAGRMAVWAPSARLNRALHLYGLDVLLGLDRVGTCDFFDVFFGLGDQSWRTMLDADAHPRATMGVMARMLAAGPWSIRRALFSTTAARRALPHRTTHEPGVGSLIAG